MITKEELLSENLYTVDWNKENFDYLKSIGCRHSFDWKDCDQDAQEDKKNGKRITITINKNNKLGGWSNQSNFVDISHLVNPITNIPFKKREYFR